MSYEKESQPSGVVRGLEAVEKIAMLGIVVFLIYEMMKFGGSDVGKGLSQAFGAAGGLMMWFAAHPNLVVSLIFTALILPFSGLVFSSTFKYMTEKAKLARAARTNELEIKVKSEGNEKVEVASVVESQAKLANKQLAESNREGSVSQRQQDETNRLNKVNNDLKGQLTPDEQGKSDKISDDLLNDAEIL